MTAPTKSTTWNNNRAIAEAQWRFACRLRTARERAGLTLEEVAERAGIGVKTLGKIESGESQNPLLRQILSLSHAVGVRMQELVGALEAPTPIDAPMTAVLQAMLHPPIDREWHGLGLGERTRLSAGALYPALARLERAGFLASRSDENRADSCAQPVRATDHDDGPAPEPGLNRRRRYRLTALGKEMANYEENGTL